MTQSGGADRHLPGTGVADQKRPMGEKPSQVPATGAWRVTSTRPPSSAMNVAHDRHGVARDLEGGGQGHAGSRLEAFQSNRDRRVVQRHRLIDDDPRREPW